MASSTPKGLRRQGVRWSFLIVAVWLSGDTGVWEVKSPPDVVCPPPHQTKPMRVNLSDLLLHPNCPGISSIIAWVDIWIPLKYFGLPCRDLPGKFFHKYQSGSDAAASTY
ncbi:hypothetical protein EYF80_015478 [Liparis tanakae]|uniref:Uncharacterized protein n=1 Tax=Liparis tanakae TaxID=230148 RepID=A0A4Z2IA04_9TELE|nr:hypothetical protein EYF80_015478 [Liparis tanakae]